MFSSFCRQICLRDAYERRDLGNFIFALECLGADVNEKDEESGKTIFHDILKTPKSGKFIECSIENGADCYSVRGEIFLEFIDKFFMYNFLTSEIIEQSISHPSCHRLILP